MNEVEAVKTDEEIATIYTLLVKHHGLVFGQIWKFGINTALRISDEMAIRYEQIDIEKREVIVIESKTGKRRKIRLNDVAMEIIQARRTLHPTDRYLFQRHGKRGKQTLKPYDRSTVARKFKEVGDIVGIRLGTHSMRKTRGYKMHAAGIAIEHIGKMLHHSSTQVTMVYIGLTDELIMQSYDDFQL